MRWFLFILAIQTNFHVYPIGSNLDRHISSFEDPATHPRSSSLARGLRSMPQKLGMQKKKKMQWAVLALWCFVRPVGGNIRSIHLFCFVHIASPGVLFLALLLLLTYGTLALDCFLVSGAVCGHFLHLPFGSFSWYSWPASGPFLLHSCGLPICFCIP